MQLRATRLSAVSNRRPTALTIAQLLPSGAGRVAAIYSDPAKPSYDECIQKNMDALGPELVVNGDFSDGLTGWTSRNGSTLTNASGSLRVTPTYSSNNFGGANAAGTLVTAGKTYLFSYETKVNINNRTIACLIPGAQTIGAVGAVGKGTLFFTAAATNYIAFEYSNQTTTSGDYFEIDNISVREIDLSKCVLFSDAAGQTPVVYPIAAGQGKGLLLDRSAGLVRGVELRGGFSPAASGSGATAATYNTSTGEAICHRIDASNLTYVRLGGLSLNKTFCVNVTNTGTVELSIRQNGSGSVAFSPIPAKMSRDVYVFTNAFTDLSIVPNATGSAAFTLNSVRELPGHHQQQPTAAARGEFSRRYNQLLATATLATQSITAIATQYRLYFTGAGTVTLSGAATGAYSAGSHTITCTAGSLTLTVAGSVLTGDLRFEADATIGLPAYQRVTTASDYDEVGFPTYHRAQTDDWAKSHMNPNGATKAYVFWAGQKMINTDVMALLEQSANSALTNGTIGFYVPNPGQYRARSHGTTSEVSTDSATAYGAAVRSATTVAGDITNDACSLTVNGTTTTNAADQGAGTYTEQAVFFGARAGTSLFANIREYAPPTILFLQPADSLSANHLAKLQKGYAKAVGVTL